MFRLHSKISAQYVILKSDFTVIILNVNYIMSRFNYSRRPTSPVKVGNIVIGGKEPVKLQSMTNTNTLDTSGSVDQIIRIADKGADLVRLTTQGVAEADNMANIKKGVIESGLDIPLVADVHFNPKAAYKAAETCDKVRINPGNFVDAARTFKKLIFTDEEYVEELNKIREAVVPFLEICKTHHTAVRLGVNHGSLSDRIMSRYGDTPAGMVESVMEYLRIFREEKFDDVIISIKASNVVVMVATVRLLVVEMEREGMHYPIHLGVTEAGDGEDGRIKSAVGIGALLSEGVGDTIRVSLSEPPENEIPVAKFIRDYIQLRENHDEIADPEKEQSFPARNRVRSMFGLGSVGTPKVIGFDLIIKEDIGEENIINIDASSNPDEYVNESSGKIVRLSTSHINPSGEIQSWIERYFERGGDSPIIIVLRYADTDPEKVKLKAAVDFGTILLNGYGNAVELVDDSLTDDERNNLLLGILQATRLRFSKTEYIACPSCGRTLFDLQSTLAEVRKATAGMKGLKIGVMGCIVNGPGEMADADYGYVGAGPGRVSIYKGKELIHKNLPAADALPALLKLIEENEGLKE